jgi:hypothetical protein
MKIFLSAVSGQFKACRDVLRSDLSAVGAKVVVQEDFSAAWGLTAGKAGTLHRLVRSHHCPGRRCAWLWVRGNSAPRRRTATLLYPRANPTIIYYEETPGFGTCMGKVQLLGGSDKIF